MYHRVRAPPTYLPLHFRLCCTNQLPIDLGRGFLRLQESQGDPSSSITTRTEASPRPRPCKKVNVTTETWIGRQKQQPITGLPSLAAPSHSAFPRCQQSSRDSPSYLQHPATNPRYNPTARLTSTLLDLAGSGALAPDHFSALPGLRRPHPLRPSVSLHWRNKGRGSLSSSHPPISKQPPPLQSVVNSRQGTFLLFSPALRTLLCNYPWI